MNDTDQPRPTSGSIVDHRSPVTLETVELFVHFGGVSALDDVSVSIRTAETVAIVGPNGAGKSTLLNAISGLSGGSRRGTITIDGESVEAMSPARRAALGVGRSFQHPRLVDHMSIGDNIALGGHLLVTRTLAGQVFRWKRAAEDENSLKRRAAAIVEFMGLERFGNHPARDIPYGPKKLADIGRAIMMNPRILLLDEPSSGLDRVEQRSLIGILQRLQAHRDLAIVVVEHHPEVVEAAATRIVTLQAGRVTSDESAGSPLPVNGSRP